MIWFYTILGLGMVVLLALVLQTLMGLRIVRFKGTMHWKVHRRLAYALILGGFVHAALAFLISVL